MWPALSDQTRKSIANTLRVAEFTSTAFIARNCLQEFKIRCYEVEVYLATNILHLQGESIKIKTTTRNQRISR